VGPLWKSEKSSSTTFTELFSLDILFLLTTSVFSVSGAEEAGLFGMLLVSGGLVGPAWLIGRSTEGACCPRLGTGA